MPELLLQSTGELLSITLSENVTSIPLADVAFKEAIAERIYDDAAAYGRDLFDKTFHDAQTRTMLTNFPANESLLLVADDPRIAAIPWE
jgi:hypothetical protein